MCCTQTHTGWLRQRLPCTVIMPHLGLWVVICPLVQWIRSELHKIIAPCGVCNANFEGIWCGKLEYPLYIHCHCVPFRTYLGFSIFAMIALVRLFLCPLHVLIGLRIHPEPDPTNVNISLGFWWLLYTFFCVPFFALYNTTAHFVSLVQHSVVPYVTMSGGSLSSYEWIWAS